MTDQDITLQVVVDHIKGLGGRIDRLGTDLRKDMRNLSNRMDKLDQANVNLASQINTIDQRLDSIEISIVEQKHEQRIHRLEEHAGLVQSV